jgi:hypothetical protein
MMDWVYGPVSAYGGSEYLLGHGFEVMGATWHHPRAVAEFATYAARRGLTGMCATTWATPSLREWPLACVLLAGKYFQDPFSPVYDQAHDQAHALAASLAGGHADTRGV